MEENTNCNHDEQNHGLSVDYEKGVKNAMKKSIDENDTHYTPNKGYIELREEIVKKLNLLLDN